MPTKIHFKKQQGFVLGFVIIMVVALSIMTTALFLYFGGELITYERNKREYLAKNAAESGLESGYSWLKNQVENPISNTFTFNGTVNSLVPNTPCLSQLGTPPNFFYTSAIQNLSTEFSSTQYENFGFDYYVITQGTTTQNSANLTIYETKFKIISCGNINDGTNTAPVMNSLIKLGLDVLVTERVTTTPPNTPRVYQIRKVGWTNKVL
jgi:Tfp pilus assembly protein PilX